MNGKFLIEVGVMSMGETTHTYRTRGLLLWYRIPRTTSNTTHEDVRIGAYCLSSRGYLEKRSHRTAIQRTHLTDIQDCHGIIQVS